MNIPLYILIASIAVVEGNPSGGYTDNGSSYGPLCISSGCVKDVNRRFGTTYKWPDDVKSYENSSDIFVKYTSRAKSDEERCRIWNAGKRGSSRRAAYRYARKVMVVYERKLRGK